MQSNYALVMRFCHYNKVLLFLMAGVLPASSVLAEAELLLFPELRFDFLQGESLADARTTPTLDLFGTARQGRFRLLGEVVVTDEDVDIERLKLGYAFSPGMTVWAGRVHNPMGNWITQYHHGNYLQTPISRPEVARFDGRGGLFPNHIIGILIDGTHTVENHAFDFSLLAGAGPELRVGTTSELHPVDLLDVGSGKHKLNITGRFAYRPDSASGNQFGLFVSHVEMPVSGFVYDTLMLTIAGVFSSWEFEALGLNGALYRVRDEFKNGGSTDESSFISAYVQADYLGIDVWTPYARLEQSFGDDNDLYVSLMNRFIPRRQVLGLRWDVTRRQALKLEASWNHANSQAFGETLLNWSAVFP